MQLGSLQVTAREMAPLGTGWKGGVLWGGGGLERGVRVCEGGMRAASGESSRLH